jgi:hypothetical protein
MQTSLNLASTMESINRMDRTEEDNVKKANKWDL